MIKTADLRVKSEEITTENTNNYQAHLDNLHTLSKIEERTNNPKLSEAEFKTFYNFHTMKQQIS
jgi:hypothetical protein